MTIYERLKQDHDKQKSMAKELAETSGDSELRNSLFDKFKAELESHANAEEQTLYATLIEIPEGQETAQHSVAEHKISADMLDELSEIDMSSSGWLVKFKTVRHDLEHHIEEEEADVFQLAEKLIDNSVAEKLAEKFEQRKSNELS